MKKSQRLRIEFTAVMAVVAMTSCPMSVQAQIAAAEGTNNLQLEEVTVTATRRSERLQDVPVSVTALSSAVLERSNVRELGDLVKLAPGLVIGYGSQPGNFSISMRGIGTFLEWHCGGV